MQEYEEYKKQLVAGRELDLSSWSVDDVGKLIVWILLSSSESSEADAFWAATELFRSLVLVPPDQTEIAKRYRESYCAGDQRDVVELLESGLGHQNYLIRGHSIYTLGKVGSVESVGEMLATFDRCIVSDPALLPRLAFEIRWIIGSGEDSSKFEGVYSELLDQLVKSENYIIRWAAVQIIQAASAVDDRSDLLAKLKDDPHRLVRYQARSEGDAMSKCVDFAMISDQYRCPIGYTMSDFEEFATDWVAKHTPEL